ncbi:hypothetical protein [Streptomyces sp. DH24]|uniref:hypothetical protein n=1 Tax=Streptomyces sp. DH24 TaxID=3040123 RepID=UPI002442C3CA|nr:hypothetical protein [Streptomyces sp. DH24]MDG9720136.1 hypothetical protein [Streptomyces sp. DH24]
MEIVLRDRITDAGTKPLFQLIKQGVEAGVLTARQAEYLAELLADGDAGNRVERHGLENLDGRLPVCGAAGFDPGACHGPHRRAARQQGQLYQAVGDTL